jgi:hypothetical protein
MICLTGKKINEPSFRRWHFLMLLVRNILFWTMRPTILYNQWFMNYSVDECAFRYCIFLLIINIPFKFDRDIVSYSLQFGGLERGSDFNRKDSEVQCTCCGTSQNSKCFIHWFERLHLNPRLCVPCSPYHCKNKGKNDIREQKKK